MVFSESSVFFTKMIGTLAVILVMAGFLSGGDIINRFNRSENKWKYAIVIGILGGVFGIYGNLSGVAFNGAVVSVRDIGPMIAGFSGGPVGGLIAGIICGVHRLTMGGAAAKACVVATCTIGLACGFLANKYKKKLIKPQWGFLLGTIMETYHLCLLLIMVKPFSLAVEIVKGAAFPFIGVNALGFAIMMAILGYVERQRELTIEKSRLQSELSVATQIQTSMLPVIDDNFPGRKEFDVRASMEAAKEIGGDFYDVFFVGDNKVAFVIADVSGKGIPAALFMVRAKQIIQNCFKDQKNIEDAATMANNSLCENNEAELFVTVWIGLMDLTTGEVEYVNAGHNPPVIYSNGEAKYLEMKKGFVMAGMPDYKYKAGTFQLNPGDKLYLYTDGVTEAENEKHDLYGEDRLLECLQKCGGLTNEEVIGKVKEDIKNHVAGHIQFDDMTMMCIEAR